MQIKRVNAFLAAAVGIAVVAGAFAGNAHFEPQANGVAVVSAASVQVIQAAKPELKEAAPTKAEYEQFLKQEITDHKEFYDGYVYEAQSAQSDLAKENAAHDLALESGIYESNVQQLADFHATGVVQTKTASIRQAQEHGRQIANSVNRDNAETMIQLITNRNPDAQKILSASKHPNNVRRELEQQEAMQNLCAKDPSLKDLGFCEKVSSSSPQLSTGSFGAALAKIQQTQAKTQESGYSLG